MVESVDIKMSVASMAFGKVTILSVVNFYYSEKEKSETDKATACNDFFS